HQDYHSFIQSLSNVNLNQTSSNIICKKFWDTDQLNILCQVHFNDVKRKFHGCTSNHFKNFSVEELIKVNIEDRNSHHLIIIGKSDSTVNILAYKLRL
ncbi:25186_t:CDS:2, partial [Gigaspora rosea]